MSTKTIRINKKGMITIPVEIRKKYNLHDGAELVILDIEGNLTIVPIYDDFSEIQKMLPTREEMGKVYYQNRDKELQLENDPNETDMY